MSNDSIEELQQQLVESQAREVSLRKAIDEMNPWEDCYCGCEMQRPAKIGKSRRNRIARKALFPAPEFSALEEYLGSTKLETLDWAANIFESVDRLGVWGRFAAVELRKMMEEITK